MEAQNLELILMPTFERVRELEEDDSDEFNDETDAFDALAPRQGVEGESVEVEPGEVFEIPVGYEARNLGEVPVADSAGDTDGMVLKAGAYYFDGKLIRKGRVLGAKDELDET